LCTANAYRNKAQSASCHGRREKGEPLILMETKTINKKEKVYFDTVCDQDQLNLQEWKYVSRKVCSKVAID